VRERERERERERVSERDFLFSRQEMRAETQKPYLVV
jgi:hypothetical protein